MAADLSASAASTAAAAAPAPVGGADLAEEPRRVAAADLPPFKLGHPLLVIDDVHVVYKVNADPTDGKRSNRWRRKPTEVHAVKGVSFTVHEGETLALLGRNGSGKSTLLKVVAGMLPATSGQVLSDGDPVLLGVGAALVPDMSGARNVIIGTLAQGLTRAEAEEQFDSIVEFAGIGEALHRPMNTYSSGQAARLRFAIGTALTPRVLLVDEALGTGDEEFKIRAEKRIDELHETAGCVVLVSHSLGTLRETCQRAVWMDAGELVADGPVDDVVDEYRSTVRHGRGG